jgi:hypothetical protein
VLPADPVSIQNARPENYAAADNPLSGLSFDATHMFPNPPNFPGSRIGNLTLGGGLDAAFSGSPNKKFDWCANLANSVSSFQNYVGVNWAGDISNITTPASLAPPIQTNIAAGFTIVAPSDRPFLNSGPAPYRFEASADNTFWTSLFSSTTAGSNGEKITITSSSLSNSGYYQFHRINFQGDGINSIGIAQLQINVANAAPNEE